jgi:lysophospholipase L1-like esterase
MKSNKTKKATFQFPLHGRGVGVRLLALFILFSGFAFMLPDKKPTIFLIGDSTCANKPLENNPERGWGQLLPNYFTNDVESKWPQYQKFYNRTSLGYGDEPFKSRRLCNDTVWP